MDHFPGSLVNRALAPAPDNLPLREEHRLATMLLGGRPEAVLPILSRGRNRLFRVCTPQAEFALKIYGPDDGSGSKRFASEIRALSFLATGPMAPHVPRVITTDKSRSAALLEWIDGDLPSIRRGGEVVQLQRVLQSLLMISRGAEAAEFPMAPAFSLRPAELAQKIEAKRETVTRIEAESLGTKLLNQFDTLWPMARSALLTPQDPARLILSPGEFGFHKALRRQDGVLVFLAFEEFGWEDPVRMVADLLWHPAMTLAPEEELWISNSAHTVFGACDGGFTRRLARLSPVYGLQWVLWMLEATLPEHAPRRNTADPCVWEAKKQRYLTKAGTYLDKIRNKIQNISKL
jgi:hypothetical protein